jgi:hypothetical protein
MTCESWLTCRELHKRNRNRVTPRSNSNEKITQKWHENTFQLPHRDVTKADGFVTSETCSTNDKGARHIMRRTPGSKCANKRPLGLYVAFMFFYMYELDHSDLMASL